MIPDPQRTAHILEDIQSTLLAVSVVIAGIAPKALPVILAALCIAAFLSDAVQQRQHFLQTTKDPLVLWGLAFSLYAALSGFWATDSSRAVHSAATFFALVFAAAYLTQSLGDRIGGMTPQRRRRFIRSIPIALVIATLFLVLETIFIGAITNAAVRAFPSIAGDFASGYVVRQDRFAGVMHFHFNRAIATCLMVLPSAILLSRIWLSETYSGIWPLALTVVFSGVVLFSDSETAKLALIVSLAFFALALVINRRLLTRTIAILPSVLILLAVPLASVPVIMNLHEREIIPESGRERLVIWEGAAERYSIQPLLGIGARSSETGHAQSHHKTNPNSAAPDTKWHPHNMYLQIWLELGVVGALLFLGFAMTLSTRLQSLTSTTQPYGIALTVILLICAQVGWGLWQTWSIAAAALGIIGLALANRSLECGGDTRAT